ncbi:MAG: T9SS type A sorting domain-containing protein, partial [Ignavibacteria bacterium]|nr:T9SS type A sorting domain-containing protein [Ignavibacteria bacterium]
EKDINRYELPPIPPQGLFDVRFIDNSLVASLNEQSVVTYNSVSYPVEIKIANSQREFIVEDLINGKLVSQRLASDKPVVITNSAVNVVKITPINQNVNYTLEQNFPNPFNPKTVIKFSIPQKEFVKLKLFNSIGEELMSLVNQELEAGYHQIEFNSTNLPAGIYFYKMSAGKFVQTRKLILLK